MNLVTRAIIKENRYLYCEKFDHKFKYCFNQEKKVSYISNNEFII